MPLNIDLQQILLHWMNLAILTGGLYFLLYKPVKDFMAKREAHYRSLTRRPPPSWRRRSGSRRSARPSWPAPMRRFVI